MAEELRFSREIVSPRVDTSRPGNTVLGKLSEALQTSGRGLERGFETGLSRAQEREAEDNAAILTSPLTTAGELRELELNARFDMTILKAQNRQGELMVQEGIADLEDALDQAADPLEARKAMIEFQETLLAHPNAQEPGVKAGIRERMARHATTLLDKASAARIAKREATERITVNRDAELSLEDGPEEFVATVMPHLTDEAFVNGNADELFVDFTTTIENFFEAGDDAEKGVNFNSGAAMEAIDQLSAELKPRSEHRQVLSRLREKIETDNERRRKARIASGVEKMSEIHVAAGHDLDAFNKKNPGVPWPEDLKKAYLDSAPTEPQRLKAIEFLQNNAVPRGVTQHPLWIEGRKRITAAASQFAATDKGQNAIGTAAFKNSIATLAIYDEIGASISPDTEPGEIRRLMQGALADAPALVKERLEAKEIQEANVKTTRDEWDKRVRKAKALNSPEKLRAAEKARYQAIRRTIGIRIDDGVDDWLINHGMPPRSFIQFGD